MELTAVNPLLHLFLHLFDACPVDNALQRDPHLFDAGETHLFAVSFGGAGRPHLLIRAQI
jgi:hypothetical protein